MSSPTASGSLQRIRKALVALAAILTLLAAGCSGDDGQEDAEGLATLETRAGGVPDPAKATPSADGDAEQALISFARCMRENGFPDYPDATLNADGSVGFGALLAQLDASGIDPQSEEFVSAVGTCADRLQGIALGLIGEGFDQTELQDGLLAFAQCMREQGVAVDDPDLADFGNADTAGQGPLANVDLDDPDVRAALDTCQREFAFPGLGGSSPSEGGRTDE